MHISLRFSSQHYASRHDHRDVCELLLERGADVNAQTRSGKASSLHRAAYSGCIAVVELLIRYGADPRLCDSDGQTPLHKVTLMWLQLYPGGLLRSTFARYVPLASQNPYPIIVYFVANYRPHLSHFRGNVNFAIPV